MQIATKIKSSIKQEMKNLKTIIELWPKVERPLMSTNQFARNQEFGLSTLHTMAKVQRPSQFNMITF